MTQPNPLFVKRISLIGLGTVGMGWAAIYLARGYDVVATDPSPDAQNKARDFLQDALPILGLIGMVDAERTPGSLHFVPTVESAVLDADLIHENGPENLEAKRVIFAEIERFAKPSAIIASSSGGLSPSTLQSQMRSPARFLVAHPFNPPHLVPLVEVIGGANTNPSIVDAVISFLQSVGKHPIKLNKEKTAYLTNRLQFALLREAIFCLHEGVASPRAIEDAVQFGLAPRWMAMGPLSTLILAGGDAGIQSVLEKFGPAIESWWRDLGNPTLTGDVRQSLMDASTELLAGKSPSDLASERDRALVPILLTKAPEMSADSGARA